MQSEASEILHPKYSVHCRLHVCVCVSMQAEAGVQYAGEPLRASTFAKGASWSYQHCPEDSSTCEVTITIPPSGMKAPVYVLYG